MKEWKEEERDRHTCVVGRWLPRLVLVAAAAPACAPVSSPANSSILLEREREKGESERGRGQGSCGFDAGQWTRSSRL
jgi:hypothetical protein